MHRSHPPMDTDVVDDDDDDDMSNQDLISSTTADYSSLMVDSPSDSMSHRASQPARSPSPTSSSMPGSQTATVRSPRRRFSHSTSPIDSTGCNPNVHRDRVRFNTWPRHRREKRDILVEYDKRLAKSVIQELGIGINKTYRNPWGNLSYAQLITRAIDSSPWKRLTLNEVYEWIVKFVPYFKDKIDAKTSWGWKNSIRHNLSLHNQFIRVPIISSLSKGPVKYVWTINPSFKNNSPYKKYSLKRKRAAAAAAAAATAAANAAAMSNGHSSTQSQEQIQESNSSAPMPTNYHRRPSNVPMAKATRLHEQAQAKGSSSVALNQLSVAAAMMSTGVTDPTAYRAFLHSQAAAMANKQKPAINPSPSASYTHESGLPVPKKLAVASDRYKQQHAEWLLSSYRQQSQSYNGNRPHPSMSQATKVMPSQQRPAYLPSVASSSTRATSDMNHLSPSLQRRVSSPSNFPPSATAQNKLAAQTKLWHAAVQAAAQAQQQQQYHQQTSNNDLHNYGNQSASNNGRAHKLVSYPESMKFLSAKTSLDDQRPYAAYGHHKFMHGSYSNAATCLIRQHTNPTGPSTLTPHQQMDMATEAYQNYRRRSSGFSSTTSHGGASDDESDEYIPPRKDSSTSNASSGYESGLAPCRQSPPMHPSMRMGSGSSIAAKASSSSHYYHAANGNSHHDLDVDVRQQQLGLHSVGGYVDDLMERIRKMPPKKRSKFYQMLDEERLKDLNNNHRSKSHHDDADIEPASSRPLAAAAPITSDDDEDRTIIEILPSSHTQHRRDRQQPLLGFNEKNFEELQAMGLPLTVLKAIAYQQQSQPSNSKAQLSNFLSNKYTVSSTDMPSDNQRLLNARTILRRILQQHQKEHSTNEKSSSKPMDYTTDEEGDMMEDDVDEHRSMSTMPHHHRNIVRSHSHNPAHVMLNSNDISSLSPPTSTASSPDETDVIHQSSPTSISRPSSTPATLLSSACSF